MCSSYLRKPDIYYFCINKRKSYKFIVAIPVRNSKGIFIKLGYGLTRCGTGAIMTGCSSYITNGLCQSSNPLLGKHSINP